MCREGKSWGRKSRCYYIPNDGVICCHNCGWYSTPINWVMELEQIPYVELMKQIDQCDYEYGAHVSRNHQEIKRNVDILPRDSINLFDRVQLEYYKAEPIVKLAASYIVKRRLNTACNRPKSLFVSLNDHTHKDRLVLPFYDHRGDCRHYQSRKLIQDETPKYLSKTSSEKTLFNYDNISNCSDHVFITEGPIDSFFIKNSVAVAGIQERSQQSLTEEQQKQLERLFLMQTVWVLDSQWLDKTSLSKSHTLLKSGHCVFIWPEDVGMKFKDINDMCMHFKIDQVTEKYILDNTYCGLKGVVKLKQIK